MWIERLRRNGLAELRVSKRDADGSSWGTITITRGNPERTGHEIEVGTY